MSYDKYGVASAVRELLRGDTALTLGGVSRQLGIERHVLERAIRESTGATFRALRARIQIEVLRKLFAEQPTLSIKQAAVMLGFGNAQSLARVSRRSCGMTPSQLRRASTADKQRVS